jgi:SagB-type dehydrogenase family enzyme
MADSLEKISEPSPVLDRIFAETAAYIQRPNAPPPVIVILAARQSLIAEKYERLAYRLSLLNAGVALGALHLVAQDIGLVGCAAGTGNPRHLSRLTGADDFEEISMAEFALGLPA